jgi:hypothetical protein
VTAFELVRRTCLFGAPGSCDCHCCRCGRDRVGVDEDEEEAHGPLCYRKPTWEWTVAAEGGGEA